MGVLAGRIPLRTGEQPLVGGGRVGLGTGWVRVLTAWGEPLAGILFPSRLGKEGTSARSAVGGTGDASWRGGWFARSRGLEVPRT